MQYEDIIEETYREVKFNSFARNMKGVYQKFKNSCSSKHFMDTNQGLSLNAHYAHTKNL